MTSSELKELTDFFGAYFHQDFLHEAPHAQGILDKYMRENRGSSSLHRLGSLIRRYVEEKRDRVPESALFGELGCFYTPQVDGLSPEAWLLHVANQFDPPS